MKQPKKKSSPLARKDEAAIRYRHRIGWPTSNDVEPLLAALDHARSKLAEAREEGYRAAAQIVAAKSDLLRGTRGGVKKACFELDLTTRELEVAASATRGRRAR